MGVILYHLTSSSGVGKGTLFQGEGDLLLWLSKSGAGPEPEGMVG